MRWTKSAALMSVVLTLPLLAQSSEAPEELAIIDRQLVIADFESEDEGWKMQVRRADDGRGLATLGALTPPPVAESVRTLYVSFQGGASAGFRLSPAAPIDIHGHVIGISLWAYGAGRLDELSLLLRDRRGASELCPLGRLDFRGWRQLHCRPPATMEQRPQALSSAQSSGLEILAIVVRLPPGSGSQLTEFSLDRMTAQVRDPHRGPPPDWNL
ncbi:MAG: flagellar filament outer layer protein FlaA [Leptospirales bacterium]|nr:flagellar filament outer layer protein FlaA [Leptospirales bacterium]